MAKNPIILEADRREEFSPVKNKTGVDSLESSQADMVKRAKRWLTNLGHSISESSKVEICPLTYPFEEDLSQADLSGYEFNSELIYLG